MRTMEKTHSAWWRGANSDPGYFSGPPPRRHNDHTLLHGAWKHWKLLVFVTLSRQVLKFSRIRSRKLPFLQETDGVMQGFVLLLQLLVAFVKRLKFLSISAGKQMTGYWKRQDCKSKSSKVHYYHHYCIYKAVTQHTHKHRSFFNLLTFASNSKNMQKENKLHFISVSDFSRTFMNH